MMTESTSLIRAGSAVASTVFMGRVQLIHVLLVTAVPDDPEMVHEDPAVTLILQATIIGYSGKCIWIKKFLEREFSKAGSCTSACTFCADN